MSGPDSTSNLLASLVADSLHPVPRSRAEKIQRSTLTRGRSTSEGYPRDLVSRLDFRRFSSPILVFKELLKTVLGDL